MTKHRTLGVRIQKARTALLWISCSDDGSELLTRSIHWLTSSRYRICRLFPFSLHGKFVKHKPGELDNPVFIRFRRFAQVL
jgi:hypothetical protein